MIAVVLVLVVAGVVLALVAVGAGRPARRAERAAALTYVLVCALVVATAWTP